MIETLSNLGMLGIIALVAGVVYVALASRKAYVGWYFGILSCAIIFYEDMTRYGLYADALLQVFYIFMGIQALFTWRKVDGEGQLAIQEMPLLWHLHRMAILGVIGIVIGFILAEIPEVNMAVLDTLTSVFAIFATWLMVHRVRSNWLYWIVIDITYMYIYGMQGAWFYVVLSGVYTVVAVLGWFGWKRSGGLVVR